MFRYLFGRPLQNGFGSSTTAQQVAELNKTNIANKVVIVTGANSGIGREAARAFASVGGKVVLAGRSLEKLQEAADSIKRSNSSADLEVLQLDLADLDSVRKFVEDFHAKQLPLHMLINNAGVMHCPYMLTKQGYEMQFGTNHLGHFLLTNLLLDDLKRSSSPETPSKIVNVSSGLHKEPYKEGIRFDDLKQEKNYSKFAAYGQSKLANILFTKELQRRLNEEYNGNSPIITSTLHPGVIKTGLARHHGFMGKVFHFFLKPFTKTIPQGAATTLFCASDDRVVGGAYYADCNEEEPTEMAQNSELAQKLWKVSEELVGLKGSVSN